MKLSAFHCAAIVRSSRISVDVFHDDGDEPADLDSLFPSARIGSLSKIDMAARSASRLPTASSADGQQNWRSQHHAADELGHLQHAHRDDEKAACCCARGSLTGDDVHRDLQPDSAASGPMRNTSPSERAVSNAIQTL